MRLHPDLLKSMLRPAWLLIIALAVLFAAGGALVFGLGQDQGETSTTFVFGNRVGFDAPIIELESHIADIVNSVEFPAVFERIENRVLLTADEDYTLDISILENTQSVVAIEVRTDRSGEADRISRIIAEEMVRFVLEDVDRSIAADFEEIDRDLDLAKEDQARLMALAGDIDPTRAEISLQRELGAITTGLDDDPAGTIEGEIRQRLAILEPLADEYRQNELVRGDLEAQLANITVERAEIAAASASISDDWYRSITPVEPTSTVPVAIALAFAAAVPALVASVLLVALNLNRRLHARDREADLKPEPRIAAA